ncbi:MAG: FAD:protein FMN transferase [Isosphaeraceae bacterium]|nr:FAD:protein FMN transferase [Isosphaeraceae bacterium]
MRSRRVENDPNSSSREVSRRGMLGLGSSAPAAPRPSVSNAGGSYQLLKAVRPAMGGWFEVRLPHFLPGAADLATRALDAIEVLESRLTVYRDDSEVAYLNSNAARGPVEVAPDLFELLQTAIAIHRETAGAYDVTTGALSTAWGFTRGPKRVPSDRERLDALARTGSNKLLLDPERKTVAFDIDGLSINLGSIGKGHAVDVATRVVRDYWLPTAALIHGGRSSLFALGSPPDILSSAWDLSVHHPLDPAATLGTLHLRDRAMGTSGATFQSFDEAGRLYGHIIDPRTGEPPTSGPLSVSVLAPTAAEADALSTAFFLIGPDRAAQILARRRDMGALFVLPAESAGGPLRVATIGLTARDYTPPSRSAAIEVVSLDRSPGSRDRSNPR